MKKKSYIFILYFFSFLSLLITKIYGDLINIAIEIDEFPHKDKIIEYYENKKSSIERNLKNLYGIKGVKVNFVFLTIPNHHEQKIKYIHDIFEKVKNRSFDILIINENFLFGGNEKIKSSFINTMYGDDFIPTNFENIGWIEQKEYETDINLFNKELLEGGKYKNNYYFLPYEINFDVIFSYQQKIDQNIKWSDFLENKEIPLMIAYDDDYELYKYFIEVVNDKYDLMNSENYKDLYSGKESNEFYQSFKNSILNMKKLNSYREANTYQVIKDFLDYNVNVVKGKASYYSNIYFESIRGSSNFNFFFKFQEDDFNISVNKNNILEKKYITICKNSDIDYNTLAKVILYLTSEDNQLDRFIKIGSIPTLDFNKNKNYKRKCETEFYGDSDGNSNGNVNSICNHISSLKDINFINMNKVVENPKSPSLFETITYLENGIHNFINSNDKNSVTNMVENIWNVLTEKESFKVERYYIYIPLFTSMIILGIVEILIFIKRNHQLMKLFSPYHCMIFVLGIILNIYILYINMNIKEIDNCKSFHLISSISTYLLFISSFIISLRIYIIYRGKANVNKGKKINKNMNILFIILFLVCTGFSVYIYYFYEKFYLITFGTINFYRKIECQETNKILILIERLIQNTIVSQSIYFIYINIFIHKYTINK